MSKLRQTRSSQTQMHEPSSSDVKTNITAVRKVFLLPDQFLQDDSSELKIERFYHPGKGRTALFLAQNSSTKDESKKLLEIIEFCEPRRSWFANNYVCSNGRIYITIRMDVTFLALHYIKTYCLEKALALEHIFDEADVNVARLLNEYTTREMLEQIADVRTSCDMIFYKYNASKTLAWLAIKTRNLAERIKRESIYCGFSSLSQNFVKSNIDQKVDEMDYLRNACDIVGSYLDLPLHEKLKEYFAISEQEASEAKKTVEANKRKSTQTLSSDESKKIKLEESPTNLNGSITSTLLDNSSSKATPIRERKVTAKEKALAKGAKGTKGIASFFKK